MRWVVGGRGHEHVISRSSLCLSVCLAFFISLRLSLSLDRREIISGGEPGNNRAATVVHLHLSFTAKRGSSALLLWRQYNVLQGLLLREPTRGKGLEEDDFLCI